MNRYAVMSVLLAALGGCQHGGKEPQASTPSESQKMAADVWMVNDIRDAAIAQAIVTQQCLYPYHFQEQHADLNELGLRDLACLAAHYRQQGGELSVPRGEASPALYQARLEVVRNALSQAGVEISRMTLVEKAPGGSGLSGHEAVKILALPKPGEKETFAPLPLMPEGIK